MHTSKRPPNRYLPPEPAATHVVKHQIWAGWVEGWGRPKNAKRRRLQPPIERQYFPSQAAAEAFAAKLLDRWGGPDRCLIVIAKIGKDEPSAERTLADPNWPPAAVARLTR